MTMRLVTVALLSLYFLTFTESRVIKFPLTRREHVLQNRTLYKILRNRTLSNKIPIPLRGNFPAQGEYYVDVNIGGQKLTLMVDTGSADVGVSAVGCSGCTKKIDNPYDPVKSATASPLGCDWCNNHTSKSTQISCKKRPQVPKQQCTMRISYVDQSGFSSALWQDTFSFRPDGSIPTKSVIGAMYFAKFDNPKEVDGILGLADKSVSTTDSPTPFDDLVATGAVDDVFSMCLHNQGGTLYLGSDEDERDDGLLGIADTTQWTPLLPNCGYFCVNLTDVRVDGVSIGVIPSIYTNGDAIVDSGSTVVSLPDSAYTAIKEHFGMLCGHLCLKGVCNCATHSPLKTPIFSGDKCVSMTDKDKALYPDVELVFGDDVVVPFSASTYLRNGTVFGCQPGTYTIGIDTLGDDNGGTILGDTFMQGYTVIHDRRSRRIGFSPVSGDNCPF